MTEAYLICPECFSHNRYDPEQDFDSKPCHHCQHQLLPAHPIEGNAELFDTLIKQTQPVLVDFWGAWSGPCRVLAPLFNELTDKYKGRVIFLKMNSEEQQVLANKLMINSLPTLILFEHGQEKQRLTGLINESTLNKLLCKY